MSADSLSRHLMMIAALLKRVPPGQRTERLLKIAALILKQLDLQQIRELKHECESRLGTPDQVIDLIEGHLVLREILPLSGQTSPRHRGAG
jgi:hypothetical protein